MKKKLIIHVLLLLMAWLPAMAQIQDPVQFKTELKTLSDQEVEIVFTGKIDAGWHVYSTDLPSGGPISATFNAETLKGAELDGKLMPEGKEIEKFDKVFDMKLRFFEGQATFVQKLKLTAEDYVLQGYLEYGACNDENCLPPTAVNFEFKGKAGDLAAAAQDDEPADSLSEASGNAVSDAASDYWHPVIAELNAFDETQVPATDRSWIYIFIMGFAGGLLALFTPCVWPIIPMTVSFFLKRTKDKKKGIRDAWTYGASIVVIYVVLGLAITLLFGASALNALSTNAIFNILFFLMLVVFAASFFGAFEITLPSKWNNAVDSKAEQTSGLLSIFLMAFTLSLVSFSCTGPIIGFLLVEVSTTGSVVAPTIGMLGFAIALALPFTLFALFPSWLKSMPKSAGTCWTARRSWPSGLPSSPCWASTCWARSSSRTTMTTRT
jgi:thiol:disulfide interchange protein DsbD